MAKAILKSPSVPAGVDLLKKENNVGANYDTDWARSYPARVARVLLLNGVMKPVVDLLATPSIQGTDRLTDVDGPVIFAANHHSHADTPLMMTAIPEPWRNRLFIGAAAAATATTAVVAGQFNHYKLNRPSIFAPAVLRQHPACACTPSCGQRDKVA
jgi:hypothetical protein